jgi:hypothetical protein
METRLFDLVLQADLRNYSLQELRVSSSLFAFQTDILVLVLKILFLKS